MALSNREIRPVVCIMRRPKQHFHQIVVVISKIVGGHIPRSCPGNCAVNHNKFVVHERFTPIEMNRDTGALKPAGLCKTSGVSRFSLSTISCTATPCQCAS